MNKFLVNNEKTYFYILIRHWKAFKYFKRCIDSVFKQNYSNYKILFVDDDSNYTHFQRKYIRNELKEHFVYFNKKRKYSVQNAYELLHQKNLKDEAVVVNLDADDWFYGNNTLAYINQIYQKYDPWLTYGDCVLWNGRKINRKKLPEFFNENSPYPKAVIDKNVYRQFPFIPLHARSWRLWLYKKIRKKDFQRPDGSWLQFCEDQAIFYPLLEMAGRKVYVVKKILYVYNIESPFNDTKINRFKQLRDELIIRKKQPYELLH